jgi:hypothetical protein
MEIAPPLWISADMHYKFKVNECSELFHYKQLAAYVSNPATNDDMFQDKVKIILDIFILAYQKWFPGKNLDRSNLHQKLVHKWFCTTSPACKPGQMYYFTWKPTTFLFGANTFEVHWILFHSQELLQTSPGIPKVNQEIIETDIDSLPFSSDNEKVNIDIESRSIFRKKVRQARLRAALAEMKAAKLAEEYYRRYEDLEDSEDSLTVDSDE